jgi:hypothetical protein
MDKMGETFRPREKEKKRKEHTTVTAARVESRVLHNQIESGLVENKRVSPWKARP